MTASCSPEDLEQFCAPEWQVDARRMEMGLCGRFRGEDLEQRFVDHRTGPGRRGGPGWSGVHGEGDGGVAGGDTITKEDLPLKESVYLQCDVETTPPMVVRVTFPPGGASQPQPSDSRKQVIPPPQEAPPPPRPGPSARRRTRRGPAPTASGSRASPSCSPGPFQPPPPHPPPPVTRRLPTVGKGPGSRPYLTCLR